MYDFTGPYKRSYLLPFDVNASEMVARDRFVVAGYHDDVLPRVYILEPNGFR